MSTPVGTRDIRTPFYTAEFFPISYDLLLLDHARRPRRGCAVYIELHLVTARITQSTKEETVWEWPSRGQSNLLRKYFLTSGPCIVHVQNVFPLLYDMLLLDHAMRPRRGWHTFCVKLHLVTAHNTQSTKEETF